MPSDNLTLKRRIFAVDLLRGVVMMIMLLDHTRDYIYHNGFLTDPADLTTTTVPLFFTRWITHFCAPVFVFLSGVSIYLQKMYGKSNRELSWFLVTRGIWLVVLEFTVIRFLIAFNFDYGTIIGMAQVIWAIGVSMIVMAALIYLPLWAVGTFGVAMIFLHNLLDRFDLLPQVAFGGSADLSQAIWLVLHQQSMIPIDGSAVFIAYPLIPWIGVMAAGYALGAVHGWDGPRRRRFLLALGLAAIALFFAVRATNIYGDPNEWATKAQFLAIGEKLIETGEPGPDAVLPKPNLNAPAFTILSFLDTTKYPVSLLFLLMTLGPAFIVLALSDGISGEPFWQTVLIVFGRVPFFFYILQWVWADLGGVVLGWLAGYDVSYLFNALSPQMQVPPDNGFSLTVVYLMWIAGLAVIYPVCLWYGNFKRKNKHWLLSYL